MCRNMSRHIQKTPSCQCDERYQRNEHSLDIYCSGFICEAEVDIIMVQVLIHIMYPSHLPVSQLWFIFNLYQAYSHLRLSHCLCNSCGRSHPGMNFLICQFIFPYTSVLSSTVLNQNCCLLQFVVRAPRDGQVEKIYFHVGENVSKNAVVIKFVKDGSNVQNTV